jgi:hypothetical protein
MFLFSKSEKKAMTSQRELRKMLKKRAKTHREAIVTAEPDCWGPIDDKATPEDWERTKYGWFDEQYEFIFHSDGNYDDEDFMRKQRKDGSFVNSVHWMDADSVTLQVFAHLFKQRVVVFEDWGKDCPTKGKRMVCHDGRYGKYGYWSEDYFVKIQSDDSTFGLLSDGEHFQYIDLRKG